MPSPEQQRRLRIEELLKEFSDRATPVLIDTVYKKVLEKYPYLQERTAREYATTIFRILKAKEKEKK